MQLVEWMIRFPEASRSGVFLQPKGFKAEHALQSVILIAAIYLLQLKIANLSIS
jgi:hypothetical protein